MRIDRTTSSPLAPAAAAPAAPAAAPQSGTQQSFNSSANAAALALQLEEEKAGGGGGGGGKHHATKTAISSIDDIAARNSLNIEVRKKSMLERQEEIERLKAEMEAKNQQVGEKEPGSDGQHKDGERPKPEDEQP